MERYFREKAITASINDQTTGIITGTGDDPELSSLYLDCSLLPQTQNIQEHYRIVAQVWSAGQGSNVSVMVTGTAGLDIAYGSATYRITVQTVPILPLLIFRPVILLYLTLKPKRGV